MLKIKRNNLVATRTKLDLSQDVNILIYKRQTKIYLKTDRLTFLYYYYYYERVMDYCSSDVFLSMHYYFCMVQLFLPIQIRKQVSVYHITHKSSYYNQVYFQSDKLFQVQVICINIEEADH